MNLKTYLNQHESIETEISAIKELLSGDAANKASDIASHVNVLAGRLKVHLSMEDKYLYPSIEKCGDTNSQKLALEYQSEMGGLTADFTNYKDKYNTSNKILSAQSDIKSDTQKIFRAIEERVKREEKELYKLIF